MIRTDRLLDEVDTEDRFEFTHEERRIVTQAYDLSIQTLVEQWKNKILILPDTQREYVWDNGRASRLIESLLLNIPIPVLYFAETEDANYEIVDGHQRVRSIVRFLTNEFSLSGLWVLNEFRRLRFHQLPEKRQLFLRMRIMRAVIISRDSHPNIKFEVFERLNSGSISLNSQEMRNSLYRGSFNDMLKSLVSELSFRQLVGTKSPRPRMVDEELLVRFFTLRNGLSQYKSPLKRFLNEYMIDVKDSDNATLEEMKNVFRHMCTTLTDLLGDLSFRIFDRSGRPVERAINRALFDAQALAASWTTGSIDSESRQRIREELAVLYESQDFLKTVQKATGNKSNMKTRVRSVVEAFQKAGLTLSLPFDLRD